VFLHAWIDQGRETYERFDYLEDTTRYLAAPFASPDGGHRGFVVHLVGRAFCADDAAGCTTLVVAREAGAYQVVGRFTNTHLPVSVFPDTSHGWPDVGVWLSGGGPREPQRVRLRFDGRQYPEDLWTAPSARTAGREILTDSTPWRWLYTPAP
jgi:putative lipoprotein